MCTAFRDGFQSVYGARVFTKDFMPAVQAACDAGITHFEAGGGARFQALYFYSNDDAFQMMDEFRQVAGPEADLQTLARGVNVVGLDSQPRDMIRLHAQLFKKHGISTIRNFDALNDVNNLIDSGKAIHDAGLRHEVTITMMALPPNATGAHDPDFYERVLRQILDADIPFDSLCFKDASGTSTPAVVFETIKRARKLLGPDMNIVFHSHETAGVAIDQYMNALEAGATQLDLSMSPCSGGTCQPDIITMWHALRGTEWDLDIDINKIRKAESVFEECMKDYFLPPEATKVNPEIPFFPLPGGALTANTQMLRDNHLMDKYPAIVEAMGECVAKGGFGTSVTPVSQFYFQQAFNNVMFGPWEKIADGYGKMVLGYFGRTPGAPDPEIVSIASEQLGLRSTDRNPLDINDENPAKGRKAAIAMLEANHLPCSDENIFIIATCQGKGIAFLKGEGKIGVRKKAEAKTAPAEPANQGPVVVTIDGREYKVELESSGKAKVNGRSVVYESRMENKPKESPQVTASAGSSLDKFYEVRTKIPGVVVRFEVKPGDPVKAADAIMVIEAMKMETRILAEHDGVLASFEVAAGEQIPTGALLALIKHR